MNEKRIFVSINIPNEIKTKLEAYLAAFYSEPLAKIQLKNNWHVTVVFCGNLNEKRLDELKISSNEIASQTPKFEMTPKKIVFYPPSAPRMVWLTFEESEEFINLCKKFLPFSGSNEKINPHITLVKFENANYLKLRHHLGTEGEDVSDEIKPLEVNSINIMESHLSIRGAEHKLVEKFNLQ